MAQDCDTNGRWQLFSNLKPEQIPPLCWALLPILHKKCYILTRKANNNSANTLQQRLVFHKH
jgi:hypothetical protein